MREGSEIHSDSHGQQRVRIWRDFYLHKQNDAPEIGVRVNPGDAISTADISVKFKLKIKGGAGIGAQQLTFSGKDDSGHVATARVTLVVQQSAGC